MKGYQEFKGYHTKLVFDATTKNFTACKVVNADFDEPSKTKKPVTRKRKSPGGKFKPV